MNMVDRVGTILQSESVQATMQALYGTGQVDLDMQTRRWLRLAGLFEDCFPGHQQATLFSTPGRTEVGGNHTDHQHGRVLCASVDLDIIAVCAPNQDGIIRLQSEGFDHMDVIDLVRLEPQDDEKGHSASLIRGIAAAFTQRGCGIGGFDAYTASRVPKGSGLSSSAAFEVLVATILDELWNEGKLAPVERAKIGQYAENHYFGKPSGLMDQCGCSVGGFMAIDFADPQKPAVTPIDLDFTATGHALVITNTGGNHADLTADYASIPQDMKQVAACFGCAVLREVDEKTFWQRLPGLRSQVTDRALLRAIHFFQDNDRVRLQADALRRQDFGAFLALVTASGSRSRTQLQNIYSPSFPDEQSLALALSVSEKILAGRGACRVHGGGFAGTIQAFVPLDLVDVYLDAMRALFGPDAPAQMRVRPLGSVALNPVP